MFLTLHDPHDNSPVIVNFNLILCFYRSSYSEVTILVPANDGESIHAIETVETVEQILEMLK